MYLDYFRMRELPFTLSPNLHFFVELEGHFFAFNAALQALNSGRAFVKITGEAGMGKTLVCRKLVDALYDRHVCAVLSNPFLSLEGVLISLCEALGLSPQPDAGTFIVLHQLEKYLQQRRKAGKKVIVFLDEAQAMPEESVDALRLLSDLEYGSEKLLQIVLLGQPELDDLLRCKKGRQVAKRLTLSLTLPRLSQQEVNTYINLRVIKSGYEGVRLFSAGAISLATELSDGIPKNINLVCHKALLHAFAFGDTQIRESHVQQGADVLPRENAIISLDAGNSQWSRLLGSSLVFVVLTLGLLVVVL